jgi:protein-tyrosine phosphatase
MRNLLFVCSANIDRSPTGEAIYKNDHRFSVKSAGTSRYARRRLSKELLEWADLILVMERNHRELILKDFPETDTDKIHCLDIYDDFRFMEGELADRIRNRSEDVFIKVFAPDRWAAGLTARIDGHAGGRVDGRGDGRIDGRIDGKAGDRGG